jgi:putative peptidoglycan lipid II flippase
MNKTTFRLMIILFISKVIGFLRQITLNYLFGVSFLSDAYLTAVQVPVQLIEVFTSCVIFVFLPEYTKIREEEGHSASDYYTKQILGILMAFSSVVFLIVQICPGVIIRLFAPGYSGEQIELSINFLRITMLCIFFISATQLFSSYLQANHSFIAPAMVTILSNLVTILSFFFAVKTKIGIWALPIGFLLAKVIEIVFLTPFIKQSGFDKSAPIPQHGRYDVKRAAFLLIPLFIGSSTSQINLMIDRGMASTVGEGAVSVMTNAALIKNLFEGIFVTAIITVVFPTFSSHFVKEDYAALKKDFEKSFNLINFTIFPIAIMTVAYALPITRIVYERGAFSATDSVRVAEVLGEYGIYLLFSGLQVLFTRLFYSVQDTKTPMYVSLVSVGVHAALSFIFVQYWGLMGIVRASSISIFLSIIIFYYLLRKKMGAVEGLSLIKEGAKAITSSFIAVTASLLVFKRLSHHSAFISLCISLFLFLIIYLILAWIMRSSPLIGFFAKSDELEKEKNENFLE